jgi:hypothetical protein
MPEVGEGRSGRASGARPGWPMAIGVTTLTPGAGYAAQAVTRHVLPGEPEKDCGQASTTVLGTSRARRGNRRS